MTARKHSPEHDFWHPIVEAQIREVMRVHPDWFRLESEQERRVSPNSLAKRVVGQLIANRMQATEIAAGHAALKSDLAHSTDPISHAAVRLASSSADDTAS